MQAIEQDMRYGTALHNNYANAIAGSVVPHLCNSELMSQCIGFIYFMTNTCE
jgi:hypothetical protein